MDFNNLKDLNAGIRLLPLKNDIGFVHFLKDLDNASKSDSPVFIALLCCPDYSYKVDKNGWVTYNHEKLGFEAGMMAVSYTKATLQLIDEIIRRNGKAKIVLFYGDNEYKYKEILNKVHLNEDEFRSRVKCNIAAGQIYYESLLTQYFPDKNGIKVFSIGMDSILYKDEYIKLSQKKIEGILRADVEKIAEERKDVIKSLYGLKELEGEILLEKAMEQILDRIIVGTAFSEERKRGNLYSIMSLTPVCLVNYFNYLDDEMKPILSLGKG